MRCRACEHPLWRVWTRACPTCDAAFAPSDYRFRPETVRFCCPHCGQGYLGTGDDGHPDPRRFECSYCGEWIDSDEMVLEPADDVEEHETRPPENPWLERHRPVWERLALTAFMGVAAPMTLLERTPRETRAGVALAYVGSVALVLLVVGAGAAVLLSPAAATSTGATFGVWAFRAGVVLGATALLTPVWAVVAQRLLTRRSEELDTRRTLHALAFTCAPHWLWLLPFAGVVLGPVGSVLWVWRAARALEAAHGSPRARARIGAFAFPAGLASAAALWFALGALGLTPGFGPGPARWGISDSERVSVFRDAVRDAIETGEHPAHAAEMLAREDIEPATFLANGSGTTLADTGFSQHTLEEFSQLAPGRQLAVIQQAAGGTGGRAHRLGDYVFAFDTLAHAASAPGLWTVVERWDPGANPSRAGEVHVLHADLSVRTIAGVYVEAVLREQNELRRSVDLAPMARPGSIRWDDPSG